MHWLHSIRCKVRFVTAFKKKPSPIFFIIGVFRLYRAGFGPPPFNLISQVPPKASETHKVLFGASINEQRQDAYARSLKRLPSQIGKSRVARTGDVPILGL
jgi:hypothetical protein